MEHLAAKNHGGSFFLSVQCCSYMSSEGLEMTTLYNDKKSWQPLSDSNKSGVLNSYSTMSTLILSFKYYSVCVTVSGS